MRYQMHNKLSSIMSLRYRRNQIISFVCGSICLWITLDIVTRTKYTIQPSIKNVYPVYQSYNLEVDLNTNSTTSHHPEAETKRILLWTKFYGRSWKLDEGQQTFKRLGCKYDQCTLTTSRQQLSTSDAIIIHARDITSHADLPKSRHPAQRWVFYLLESPYHMQLNLTQFNGLFNWTSTYSTESDVPTPYGHYVNNSRTNLHITLANKSRMVAWFVTNCNTENKREEYIDALSRYIMVDTYGPCGSHRCDDPKKCFRMLKQSYRYYLSFENSNCHQYISEKFWLNALQNDVIPIVMGAAKEEYVQVAPPSSFIHIDDYPSPQQLARHLKILSRDHDKYKSYFQWKLQGEAKADVKFSPRDSEYWCNLCEELHQNLKPQQTYHQLDKWWSIQQQCRPR